MMVRKHNFIYPINSIIMNDIFKNVIKILSALEQNYNHCKTHQSPKKQQYKNYLAKRQIKKIKFIKLNQNRKKLKL